MLTDVLSRVWIFEGLSQEELAHLASIAQTKTVKARRQIVKKGDPAADFFVLLSGRAKVAAPGAGGSDTVLNVMGPGEVFGEIGILDGRPRSATVTTLEDCEMALVNKSAFQALLVSAPSIAVKLLAVLAGRIRQLSDRVEDRAFLDVPSRLAKQLLWLAKNHGIASDTRIRIALKLSQQDLGELIGATRESVNKYLRDWTRSGVLRHEHQHLEILDTDALESIAEGR